jgi:predicted metalloprotease with PDZ domain
MHKQPSSRVIFIAALVWLAGHAPQAQTAEAPEPIAYTLRAPAPETHYAEVEMTVPTGRRASVELMMAAWSPGFYRIENYSRRVERLSARTPEGKALEVDQPQKNRWQVRTGGAPAVVVSYRLRCDGRSVTTNWVGADYAVLNGAATFLTLAERAPRPHVVRLELPAAWKRSMTALDPAGDGLPDHYRAADFDTLVDSPIVAGNLTVSEFEVEGSKHYLVHVGDVGPWDPRRAEGDLKKIVREHHRMWGFLPFKKYLFLLVFREGGGGLEHKNSTLVTTSSSSVRTPGGYASWVGLVSHEYFHAYNAKRLRPVELGPFDYEKEVRTTGLWVAEGLTTYYGDLTVRRAGLNSRKDFLARLSSQIKQLQNSPGRKVQTLEQSSSEVWRTGLSGVGSDSKSVSYYVKGPVVGFLLDARIRRATEGSKTLDDLMKLAYARYSGERGFTREQFLQAAEEVAGADLKQWFKVALSSTEELDYAEALEWFGLRFAPSDGREKTWRLEIREDATDAQRAHLKEWLDAAPENVAPARRPAGAGSRP